LGSDDRLEVAATLKGDLEALLLKGKLREVVFADQSDQLFDFFKVQVECLRLKDGFRET
jgi:hypothetical protein